MLCASHWPALPPSQPRFGLPTFRTPLAGPAAPAEGPPGCRSRLGQPSGTTGSVTGGGEHSTGPARQESHFSLGWMGTWIQWPCQQVLQKPGVQQLESEPVNASIVFWKKSLLREFWEVGGMAVFGSAPILAAAGVECLGCDEVPVLLPLHPGELNVHLGACPGHLVRSLGVC